jgi:hypothetical protein
MLTYSINLIHTIYIDAPYEDDAVDIFENIYAEHHEYLPESGDIDHSVDWVVEVPKSLIIGNGLNTEIAQKKRVAKND